MENIIQDRPTKIVKAYCPKSQHHYGLLLQRFGAEWKVVNMIDLAEVEAGIIASQVPESELSSLTTNDNLVPCEGCDGRRVRGCACEKRRFSCRVGSEYNFGCIYCRDLTLDYRMPTRADIERAKKAGIDVSGSIVIQQGIEVPITFSNVEWKHFDKIGYHIDASSYYREPKIHVKAEEKNIEFHGYNISEMNEGVYYEIGANDDFTIECDVNTTTIKPHPGGHFYVDFGLIKAEITQTGGSFTLQGRQVATVGARFRMKLSVKNGSEYSVAINGIHRGTAVQQSYGDIKIIFGFWHGSHHCELLSRAYINDINMSQLHR